jgi:hypothetical protein
MQLLIDINEETKLNALLEFFKGFNIKVTKIMSNDIAIPETEKTLMRQRLQNAKPENFKNWDDLKNTYNID